MSKVVKRLMIDTIRAELGGARDLLVLNTSKLGSVKDGALRATLRKKGTMHAARGFPREIATSFAQS